VRRAVGGLLLAAGLAVAVNVQAAPPRVLSLDQCADQYVLALAPRETIAGLSPRADDEDAWLRSRARGAPLRRPTLETALAVRPDLVVRFWGGDPRLVRRLEASGARVVQIDEAADFDGVRANVRRVAAALDRRPQGEALIRDMDARLARSRGAWRGERALYLTPGGFTAGEGTLVGAMMAAAGLISVAGPGYSPVSLERLVLTPPRLLVLGFFDTSRRDRWGGGRHPQIRRLARSRAAASLPGSMLGCPAWFAAEGAERLAAAAPRR